MKTKALIAVGTVGIASSAFAGVQPPPNPNDTVLNLANFSFATQATGSPNWSAIQSQVISVPANPLAVIGFTIEFDYAEAPVDASYASDLAMRISSPDFPFAGSDFVVGGSSYDGASFGVRDATWDFNGVISSPPGHYKHTTLFAPGTAVPKSGSPWTFEFQMTYNAGNSYSNVVVILHKIPAPGALALLGVAGVVGGRRRRRA